jgi:hypothetical protein
MSYLFPANSVPTILFYPSTLPADYAIHNLSTPHPYNAQYISADSYPKRSMSPPAFHNSFLTLPFTVLSNCLPLINTADSSYFEPPGPSQSPNGSVFISSLDDSAANYVKMPPYPRPPARISPHILFGLYSRTASSGNFFLPPPLPPPGSTGSSGGRTGGKLSLADVRSFTVFQPKGNLDSASSAGSGGNPFTTFGHAPSNGFVSTGSFGDYTGGNSSGLGPLLSNPPFMAPAVSTQLAFGPSLSIQYLLVEFKTALQRDHLDGNKYAKILTNYLVAKGITGDRLYPPLYDPICPWICINFPEAADALFCAKNMVLGPQRETWRGALGRYRRCNSQRRGPLVSTVELRALYCVKIAKWPSRESVLAIYDGYMETNRITTILSPSQYGSLRFAIGTKCGAHATELLDHSLAGTPGGRHPDYDPYVGQSYGRRTGSQTPTALHRAANGE